MLFLTYWFVLFAAILFPLYWVLPSARARCGLLVVGSAVFHTHFAGAAGVLPIIALGTVSYFAALTRNAWFCRTVALLNCLALVYYKYTTFLAEQVVCKIFPNTVEVCTTSPYLHGIVPPLAISFFVFEYIHYLQDVASGSEPIRRPSHFALFSIFWPSIVAGPVKRYQDFLPQLEHGLRHVGTSDVAEGLVRIGIGFSKKIIADNLTAYITVATPEFAQMSLPGRWYFVGCIGVRILLDFSGYTDMAIGFARMFGIGLPENFRTPYLATNLSGFWRRWHMSLSNWIRDYIYIALGGNRQGVLRTTLNALLAFALCGLWHGAGFNFLTWGLMHGGGLAIASNYRRLGAPGRAVGRLYDAQPLLGWLTTITFVFVSWLYFFYPVSQANEMALQLIPEVLR